MILLDTLFEARDNSQDMKRIQKLLDSNTFYKSILRKSMRSQNSAHTIFKIFNI
jgi:hypothetical protein